MPEESRKASSQTGPYRTPQTPGLPKQKKFPWFVAAVALLGLICVVLMFRRSEESRPSVEEIPKDLLASIGSFPLINTELPPATPLAPLLVADRPDNLAVLRPREGAQRLRRGERLTIRFNRPMVEGRETDRELTEMPIRFDPPIDGSAEWTSRGTLVFRPAPGAWTTSVSEHRLLFTPGLSSLDGETLVDERERVIVLDGAPRVERHRSQGRVNAGSPLPLIFDAPVNTGRLRSELLAYEIGGGQRSLPFQVVARGEDERGDFRVDIQLRKSLEPGARIGLAVTPRFLDWGNRPGIFEYELTPPPQIEGIACPEEGYSASQCRYTESPGRVIDIGPTLRLLASADLAEPAASSIRISPPLKELRVSLAEEGYSPKRRLSITGEWEPDQVYEVRVGQLATTDGEKLRSTPPLAVRSAGHPADVRVKTGRATYESDAEPLIRFAAINHGKGQILYKAVETGRELDALLHAGTYLGPGEKAFPLQPLAPTARPNRWGPGEFSWRAGTELEASMAVVGFWPTTEQPRNHASVAFVQSTDLGVTLRGSEEDLLVWVTSLATGAPVAGAEVSVGTASTSDAGSGRTNEEGIAVIHLETNPVRTVHAVLVSHGDDRAALLLDPRSAVTPAGMGLTPGASATASELPVASVFADRGAYRPGEPMHAKVTLRNVDGDQATPVRDGRFVIKLFSPSDTAPVDESELILNQWGTGDASFDLPNNLSLGEHTLEVFIEQPPAEGQSNPRYASIGSTTVQVARFRQPTFRVDVEAPETALHEGDTISFSTEAVYLFGAPVGEAELAWSIVRRGSAPYPEQWREYLFTAVDTSQPSGTITSGDGRLDAEGRAELEAQVSLGVARRGRVLVEAEVTDSAGQTYSSRETLTVYPAAHEVGLRRGDDWISLGEELDLEAIVIDHEGELASEQAIDARIVREGWHSWWEWSDQSRGGGALDDEGYRLRRNRRAEEVHHCPLTSEASPVHCLHTPTRPGTYLLEVTLRDEQGRQSTASRRVYVAGPDEHPDRDAPGAPIEVTPTRRRWSVGETAELAFESPWDTGRALITIEREGLLHSEIRELSAGGQELRIPVTAEMVPNAFVGVTLIRERTGEPDEGIDLHSPDLRFGVAELRVQPATTQLEVDIDLPTTEARSGEEVPITVTITDADGQPVQGEVALWAVDEGTLRLTDYQTPDPTAGVFRPRSAAFAWDDIRRQLVSRIAPPPMPLAGGDGRGEDAGPLPPEGEAFDPTPLWEPHLVTDAQGRVRATLTLPQRETEYRIMAVVLDEGVRWGRGSAQLVATQPMVLRPAFPRFLRAGDQFEATVFLHNTTEETLRATVTPVIGGERGEARQVEVEPDAEVRVSHQVTAPETGPLTLRFEASTDDYSAHVEQRLSLLHSGRLVRNQVVGGDESGHSLDIALPEGTQRAGGRVTVTIASHPFLGFDGAIAALEDSWWSNAESLATTVLAYAAYAELGLEGRPGALSREELEARAERAVEQLLERQTYEGGFGRWSTRDMSSPRITTLALHALQRAEAAGIEVPDRALERCRENLTDMARGSYFGDDYSRNSADNLAFALRVLADGEAPQTERADAQYEQRERLTPFGQVQLALALGDDPRADTLLLEAIETVTTDREEEQQDPSRLRWRDRSARVYGAVLEAASRLEVGREHTQEIARRLLALRHDDQRYPWGTSLETALALAALSSYARLFTLPQSGDPRLTLDGEPIPVAGQSADARWFRLPLEDIIGGQHSLQLESGDDGPVFYVIDGQWALPLSEADETARGRVVALHRVFETAEGRRIEEGAEIPLGTMIRVRLFVYSEGSTPPLVAIRDPFGAGFEAVDSTLDTTPRQSLESLFGMGPDDNVVDPRAHIAMRSLNNISHREMGAEAATFYLSRLRFGLSEFTYAVRATSVGEFTIPPANIDALYDAGYVGRSSAAQLTVVAP